MEKITIKKLPESVVFVSYVGNMFNFFSYDAVLSQESNLSPLQ